MANHSLQIIKLGKQQRQDLTSTLLTSLFDQNLRQETATDAGSQQVLMSSSERKHWKNAMK